MNIRLNKLKLENFKGLRLFEFVMEGKNATIKAENGVGKTTVYDIFYWVLFGKNSEGKTDFEVRPLDSNNQPIKGLITFGEIVLDFDGTVHAFRKEQHEKVVKKQLRGYETFCWIDEVPKKVGEYQDYITQLISEDTFKLLTDLTYFNDKLHWSARRRGLVDIAGEIGTPEGFGELIAALNGRTIKDYKKVLSEQKKLHEKERDEINPRIDEIQHGLDEYAGIDIDIEVLPARRVRINAEIKELDGQRKKLFEAEQGRQEKIGYIHEMEKKKIQREGELVNDTTGIKSLLDEKTKLGIDSAERHQEVFYVENKLTTLQTLLSDAKGDLNVFMARLNQVRDDYAKASEAPTDKNCYACGQKLPSDELVAIEEKRKAEIVKLAEQGNGIMADVATCKKAIAESEAGLLTLTASLKTAEAVLQTTQRDRNKRYAEIDKLIKANATLSPESDHHWKVFDKEIKRIESEIGKPAAEQLQAIDDLRAEKVLAVAALDKALAHADRMKQVTARITELELMEQQLAQKIADVEKELADIDRYNATESRMIELAVNGKFKHVEFKLFNQLLNGGLEECCEATFNGVPYTDMSFGQRIFVGIDVINVLSEHYGVTVPIFIDHAESLTLPIETKTQTIKLFAQVKTKKLIVEMEGELAHV